MVGMCSRIIRDRGEGVEKSSRKLLNSLYGLGGSTSEYIDFFCRLGGCGSEQVTNSRFRIFPRFDMRGSINGARRSSLVHSTYPLDFVIECSIFFSFSAEPVELESKSLALASLT